MPRPKIEISWNKVNKWLKAGCSGVECAAALGISPDTLYRACENDHKVGFAFYSAQKKQEGAVLLKSKRFEKALEGDNTMIIWLSKQMLGETDKPKDEDKPADTTFNFNLVLPERDNEEDE